MTGPNRFFFFFLSWEFFSRTIGLWGSKYSIVHTTLAILRRANRKGQSNLFCYTCLILSFGTCVLRCNKTWLRGIGKSRENAVQFMCQIWACLNYFAFLSRSCFMWTYEIETNPSLGERETWNALWNKVCVTVGCSSLVLALFGAELVLIALPIGTSVFFPPCQCHVLFSNVVRSVFFPL